jgi:hypothetical protein
MSGADNSQILDSVEGASLDIEHLSPRSVCRVHDVPPFELTKTSPLPSVR